VLIGRRPRAGRAEARAAKRKADEPAETMPLVGRSPAMQDIYRACWRG
jgi:two-component system nitrogen regulation response regulator GlnG